MGPGGPAGLRRGPRGPHPTALRPEAATPVPTVEQQRRHQTKPQNKQHHRPLEPEEGRFKSGPRRQEMSVQATNKDITISEGITVKELAEKMGVKGVDVIKKLVQKKIFATINQTLDVKLAEDIAMDFGALAAQVSYEEESTQEIELAEVEADREKRPPVVTIMGHVDHGKTSLLDAIRLTNVAAREAGGITQHIGAYRIEHKGQQIAFIDTPGHQAFTRMRARGAKVTDIVILVVAADDGVMPQTLEAIDHAKAAKVPIIVAINKVDKPDAQVDRIKQQLADRGLLAEDWGGDVVMVPVSAKTRHNLDLLLEMILLVSEMLNLRANRSRPGMGSVLEAHLDRGRGPVATVLVRNGMLNVGDFFICGSVFGKIRAMYDDLGAPIRTADPSQPVEVVGLESLPEVGDSLQVVTDTSKAKQIVMFREAKSRDIAMAQNKRVTLESLSQHFKDGEMKELNIIVKADVGGTAEVLSDTLQKLSNEKVRLRVLRAAVGAITESDVLLATTSNAIVVGFNVRPERGAQAIAEQEKVDIRLHTIIYNLTDEIKRAMTGMLEPVFKEVYQGRAEVRETFRITKVGTVAGCYVSDGFIKRDSEVRLLRDNVVVHTGRVDALKRFKNDASEVKTGFECGISLVNFHDIKPKDIIEAYVTEKVAAEAFV
jgi:translation initiation factor IF-2